MPKGVRSCSRVSDCAQGCHMMLQGVTQCPRLSHHAPGCHIVPQGLRMLSRGSDWAARRRCWGRRTRQVPLEGSRCSSGSSSPQGQSPLGSPDTSRALLQRLLPPFPKKPSLVAKGNPYDYENPFTRSILLSVVCFFRTQLIFPRFTPILRLGT